jgi:adenosylhomocysteinase
MSGRARLLPVTQKILAASKRRASVVIVQHLLEDTAEFVMLLRDRGFDVPAVVGIPYSVSAAAQQSLAAEGVDVVVPPLTQIGAMIRRILSELGDEPVIVHEVGGYCADILRSERAEMPKQCVGFVEETKQGLWRYQRLDTLSYPVVHIAESRLKDMEAPFVGRAVTESILEDLTSEGIRPQECLIGVIGIGIIGGSVAASLARRFQSVRCWDSEPIARLHALSRGLRLASRAELLATSNVIIGATGSLSVHPRDLEKVRDGVMLTSASSRRIELPVAYIRRHGTLVDRRGFVQTFQMPSGKSIRVVNDGYPVNFRRRSLPPFIADLMFAQIAAGIDRLLTTKLRPGLHVLPKEDESRIAHAWLACHQDAVSGLEA